MKISRSSLVPRLSPRPPLSGQGESLGTRLTVALITIAIATGYMKCGGVLKAAVALIAIAIATEMWGGTEAAVALIAIAIATGYTCICSCTELCGGTEGTLVS